MEDILEVKLTILDTDWKLGGNLLTSRKLLDLVGFDFPWGRSCPQYQDLAGVRSCDQETLGGGDKCQHEEDLCRCVTFACLLSTPHILGSTPQISFSETHPLLSDHVDETDFPKS